MPSSLADDGSSTDYGDSEAFIEWRTWVKHDGQMALQDCIFVTLIRRGTHDKCLQVLVELEIHDTTRPI